jgi:N-acetylglutamate synthase-like GNAT family acetyltransferase
MPGFRINYLVDHSEYIPQLAGWLFQEWDAILGEKTPEARVRKLRAHMNRDLLPIAWVAHAHGQLLGTAALRVHDIEGHDHLSPWLGGVFVGAQYRRRGIGAALCATVEDAARSRGVETLYLFTLDKQAWYSRLGWTVLGPCVWHERPGEIMCKQLQNAVTSQS